MRILKSLMMILAVGVLATGATSSYFSSKASITENTFSTGVLEIRVNGQPSILGATFSPMAPDQIADSPEYHMNNYGQPWFDGPSTLTAKKLLLSTNNPNDYGSGLWNKVMIKVEVNRGWSTWQEAYNGKLKNLHEADLLSPRWTELVPGESEMIRYQIWLPNESVDQNWLMGQTLTWDFVVEGRTN